MHRWLNPLPVKTEMGIYYTLFFLLWFGNVEWCAENEEVVRDAAATAMCIFIKAFSFLIL